MPIQNHDMITKFTEQIRGELVEQEFATLNWEEIVPIDFDVPEGIQSIRSFAIERLGKMQIASGGLGEAFPTVDYNLTSKDAELNYAKTGYTVSRADMEAEKITGLKPLGIKIEACYETYHEFMTDNTLNGTPLIPGSTGILNAAGVKTSAWGTTVQEDGKTLVTQLYADSNDNWTYVAGVDGSSPIVMMPMEDMSAEQLFLAFVWAMQKIPAQTLGKAKADTVLMPLRAHQILSTKVFLRDGRTVLAALESIEGKIMGERAPALTIIGTPFILNQRMAMYAKLPKAMRLYIGHELLFLPNQDVGIDQYVPAFCKVSGLVVDNPHVIHYFTGVESAANTIMPEED